MANNDRLSVNSNVTIDARTPSLAMIANSQMNIRDSDLSLFAAYKGDAATTAESESESEAGTGTGSLRSPLVARAEADGGGARHLTTVAESESESESESEAGTGSLRSPLVARAEAEVEEAGGVHHSLPTIHVPFRDDGDDEGIGRRGISFGTARNMMTGSLIAGADRLEPMRAAAAARAVGPDEVHRAEAAVTSSDSQHSLVTSDSDNTFDYREDPNKSNMTTRGGVLRKSSFGISAVAAPATAAVAAQANGGSAKKLSSVSRMYDLDGDGVLNPIEQAMRDRDVDGDGRLDNAEVYRIVQDRLRAEHDKTRYRKYVAMLLGLVAIMALCQFGTSWATAILTKEVNADSDTGTVRSRKSQRVIGFQNMAHNVEMEQLTDEEFSERRRLVDESMAEDIDHEDHLHRRLGKKKNNACTCSKIAYDHNKIDERDLEGLVKKCDGVNTVNMRRRWRNRDGTSDEDYDSICGPGTAVVRRKKRKKNKHKNKTKFVDERVTFRREGTDGLEKSVHFDCDGRGSCYVSGETLLQGIGHPCNPNRDLDGASECIEGLVCHDPDGWGSGTCVGLRRYALEGQACDVGYGVDACINGHSCDSSSARAFVERRQALEVDVGVCTPVGRRMGKFEVCDASFRDNACQSGHSCVGSDGKDLRGLGYGICTQLARSQQRSGGVCDLSYGADACGDGMYCRDVMMLRSGGYGGGDSGGPVSGGYSGTSAVISGPSGTVVAGNGQGGGAAVAGNLARSSGTGTCARARSVGATCGSHEECGAGRSCVGLGAATGNGGVIQGSSGTIVYGDGGVATSGYCG